MRWLIWPVMLMYARVRLNALGWTWLPSDPVTVGSCKYV